jgi:para-aminobenzoate synthetase component I
MPREILLDTLDKKQLLALTRLFADKEGTCLLYSGGSYETSCCSYLCLFPFETICKEGKRLYRRYLESNKFVETSKSDPWDGLIELLPQTFDRTPFPEWVGFIGYEMGAFSERDKTLACLPAKTPDLYLQRSGVVIAVEQNQGRVIIADQAAYMWDKETVDWVERLGNSHQWKELIKTLEENPVAAPCKGSLRPLTPFQTCEAYMAQVERAKEWILSGDVYQLNLSQQLSLQGYCDPFEAFCQLSEKNPAPFSAYLRLNGLAIVSSSPERFLKKREGQLESCPIKGTMPRGKSLEEDQRNLDHLLTSEKEQAELLMITDLVRNDLGRVSLPGSVVTQRIGKHEAYANVFHLMSIIQSRVEPSLHPIEIIRACFPGGSITGCPKLRAMELIRELEQRPRGIYTGSIGYLAGNGDFDFNIAIRTLTHIEDRIELQVGGAITSDSDPKKEYEETLHKGATLLDVLGVS